MGFLRHCLRIEEAIFLNGLTPLRPGTALTVDSLLGAIYEIDLKGRTARRWFQHEQLTKCSDEPMLPGVNGIKVFGDKVFVTNTLPSIRNRSLFGRTNYQPPRALRRESICR